MGLFKKLKGGARDQDDDSRPVVAPAPLRPYLSNIASSTSTYSLRSAGPGPPSPTSTKASKKPGWRAMIKGKDKEVLGTPYDSYPQAPMPKPKSHISASTSVPLLSRPTTSRAAMSYDQARPPAVSPTSRNLEPPSSWNRVSYNDSPYPARSGVQESDYGASGRTRRLSPPAIPRRSLTAEPQGGTANFTGGFLGRLGFEKDKGDEDDADEEYGSRDWLSSKSLVAFSPEKAISVLAPVPPPNDGFAAGIPSPRASIESDGSAILVNRVVGAGPLSEEGEDEEQEVMLFPERFRPSEGGQSEAVISPDKERKRFWQQGKRTSRRLSRASDYSEERSGSPTPRKSSLPPAELIQQATPTALRTAPALVTEVTDTAAPHVQHPRLTNRRPSSFLHNPFAKSASRVSLSLDLEPVDDPSFQLKGFRHISGVSHADSDNSQPQPHFTAYTDALVSSPLSTAPPSAFPVKGATPSRPISRAASHTSLDELVPAAKVSVAIFRKGIRRPSESNVNHSPRIGSSEDDEDEDDIPLGLLGTRAQLRSQSAISITTSAKLEAEHKLANPIVSPPETTSSGMLPRNGTYIEAQPTSPLSTRAPLTTQGPLTSDQLFVPAAPTATATAPHSAQSSRRSSPRPTSSLSLSAAATGSRASTHGFRVISRTSTPDSSKSPTSTPLDAATAFAPKAVLPSPSPSNIYKPPATDYFSSALSASTFLPITSATTADAIQPTLSSIQGISPARLPPPAPAVLDLPTLSDVDLPDVDALALDLPLPPDQMPDNDDDKISRTAVDSPRKPSLLVEPMRVISGLWTSPPKHDAELKSPSAVESVVEQDMTCTSTGISSRPSLEPVRTDLTPPAAGHSAAGTATATATATASMVTLDSSGRLRSPLQDRLGQITANIPAVINTTAITKSSMEIAKPATMSLQPQPVIHPRQQRSMEQFRSAIAITAESGSNGSEKQLPSSFSRVSGIRAVSEANTSTQPRSGIGSALMVQPLPITQPSPSAQYITSSRESESLPSSFQNRRSTTTSKASQDQDDQDDDEDDSSEEDDDVPLNSVRVKASRSNLALNVTPASPASPWGVTASVSTSVKTNSTSNPNTKSNSYTNSESLGRITPREQETSASDMLNPVGGHTTTVSKELGIQTEGTWTTTSSSTPSMQNATSGQNSIMTPPSLAGSGYDQQMFASPHFFAQMASQAQAQIPLQMPAQGMNMDPHAMRQIMKQAWQAQFMAAAYRASEDEWERASAISGSGPSPSISMSMGGGGSQAFIPHYMPGYPFYPGGGPPPQHPFFAHPAMSPPAGMYAYGPPGGVSGAQSVYGGEFGPPSWHGFPQLQPQSQSQYVLAPREYQYPSPLSPAPGMMPSPSTSQLHLAPPHAAMNFKNQNPYMDRHPENQYISGAPRGRGHEPIHDLDYTPPPGSRPISSAQGQGQGQGPSHSQSPKHTRGRSSLGTSVIYAEQGRAGQYQGQGRPVN